MPVFALFVTDERGYCQVMTFDTALMRGLAVIALSSQPLVLTLKDYPAP